MKHTSRKLLSLLMALAIMLSFVPTALAEDLNAAVTVNTSTNGTVIPAADNATLAASASIPETFDDGYKVSGTVSWSIAPKNGGTGGATISGNSTSATISFSAAGTYTVTATGSATKTTTETPTPGGDTGGNEENTQTRATETKTFKCTGDVTVTKAKPAITVEVTPTLTLTSGVTPTNNTITATVTGSTQGVDWAIPTTITAVADITGRDGNVLTITPKAGVATTVTGEITATSREDTTKKATCTVTINKAAAATASITLGLSTINVSASTTATATTNLTSIQYDTVEWTGADGTGKVSVVRNPSNPLQANVQGVSAGTASVTVKFLKDNEVLATQTASITVNDPTVAYIRVGTGTGVSSVAAGSNTSVTLVNAPAGSSVTWSASSVNVTNGITFTPMISTTAANGTSTSTTMSILSSVPATSNVKIYAAVTSGGITTTYDTTISITKANLLTISPASTTLDAYGQQATLTPYFDGKLITTGTVYWEVVGASYPYTNDGYISISSGTGYNYNRAIVTALASTRNGYPSYVRATYTVGGLTYEAQCPITVGYASSQINAGVTVYDGNTGYALTDTPDEGNTGSIASQIDTQVASWFRTHSNSSYNYRYYTVHFSGNGTAYESGSSSNYGRLSFNTSAYSYDDLGKVVFTPGTAITTANGSYVIRYNFTVRVYPDGYNYGTGYYQDLTGTLTFTVKRGTSTAAGDINYSSELGKNVSLSVDDFEDFWYSLYNRGTLSYVTFGSVSGGTVYTGAGKNVGSASYYVNPTRNQNDLAGIYFAPNSTTSRTATTIRIPFTATGTTTTNSNSTTSRSGTIVITYLSAAANAINYTTSSNGVATLKAQDFIDAYKAAVKTSTNPTNLTIVFQNVPTYGTLTYNDSSKSNSKDVKLTNTNAKNYSFTTKTSGSNQVGDVTYAVSATTARTESISYIGYIGSTATFTGTVNFTTATAPTNVVVNMTCSTSAGVALSSSSFTNADQTLRGASYVALGTPQLGTLKSTTGPVSSAIWMEQLGTVTYVPGTNGTDSFTFKAYNASNQLVASGTVRVVVSVVNTGAITSITQFTDIPAPGVLSDWYRTQLTYLINRGMINGKGNGKFGPDDDLEYSEALKFIMNAAGYTYEQSTTPGTNWAQNYKDVAVSRGWMSSTVDLTKPITRDAMAELAARILGIPAASGASPFSDSNNMWAAALYNAKIVIGNDSTAKPTFNGSGNLTRAQMVCLVYRMYQYSGK